MQGEEMLKFTQFMTKIDDGVMFQADWGESV